MILMTLTEGNGAKTRLPVMVTAIADEMETYFESVGLIVEREETTLSPLRSQAELNAAAYYFKEYKEHGKTLKVV